MEKDEFKNPRKGMVCYTLWMTKGEESLLLKCIKSIPSLAMAIIKKAYKRGDFNKR